MFNSVEINSTDVENQVKAMIGSITGAPSIMIEVSHFQDSYGQHAVTIDYADFVKASYYFNFDATLASGHVNPSRFDLETESDLDTMIFILNIARKFHAAFNLSAAGVFHTVA